MEKKSYVEADFWFDETASNDQTRLNLGVMSHLKKKLVKSHDHDTDDTKFNRLNF